MTRNEYFAESNRLALVYEDKFEEFKIFSNSRPDLSNDALFAEYLALEDDASDAARQWIAFCQHHRDTL